ncbi:DUF1963 domain-containing protein [Saccharothrix coeruleofusca]|uniref:DUF1963 domain-containing protein n=1 Tax=Saccharothrix coeruleofusca TaxID=33919 RepID=A0A918AIP1_9PSEU|nr:DUF1963 domain-containing protein [Saccharothrix coeruleofusca]GGP44875.1 hypothetical protein GCM10010185_15780 [Saccharothrix coeruleofusca]
MDRYQQFRHAAIDRGFPDDEVDKFADQLRFAVWAGACGDGEEVVGQKGGLPRLPVGVEWPSSEAGSPLPFIASVDCAALPRAEGLPLPEDGSLLFFLHHESDYEEPLGESGYARVLYVPAGAETVVAAPPPDHDSTRFFNENIPFLLPEYRLTAWVEAVLPDWIGDEEEAELASDLVKELLADLKHLDELCELVDELWPPREGATFYLGGYCGEIGGQDPPRAIMADANFRNRHGAGPDFSNPEQVRLYDEEEYRFTREWVPLAEFRTNSDYYYGCFMISLDDLAARRFDRMRSFTMFTE